MAKYFLKIEANTAAKNKLQEAIKREVSLLDRALYPTFQKAKYSVYKAFEDAENSYQGRCKEPNPTGAYTSTDDSCYTIWIANMITVSIYLVKKDFT